MCNPSSVSNPNLLIQFTGRLHLFVFVYLSQRVMFDTTSTSTQQKRDSNPIYVQCWSSVYHSDPTLYLHCFTMLRYLYVLSYVELGGVGLHCVCEVHTGNDL